MVPGNGTNDDTLLTAGITRAAGFVTAIDDDADNVHATISARALNPELFIVSRASTKADAQAGAGRRGPRHLALCDGGPTSGAAGHASRRGDLSFSLEEIGVDAQLDGKSVADLRRRGMATMAIRHDDGNYEANLPSTVCCAWGSR